MVVFLSSATLHFRAVNGGIVMLSYFILTGTQWWHCYGQLLYTFRQSMVVLLCSAALYFQAVNGGIVMVSFFSNFLSCTDTATLHDVIGTSVYLFNFFSSKIV
jgi:hypothetical protein